MKPALIQYLPVGIVDLKDYDIILSLGKEEVQKRLRAEIA